MIKQILPILLILPVALYLCFITALYFYQEALIFPGEKLPADHQFQFDHAFEELTIAVDGAELNALHFKQENPRGLVFFLHGNGGNLASWTVGAEFYLRVNYDMFMLDYRGYGKSTGTIQSEKQLHQDIRTAWDIISKQYTDRPILIYGRSLGAALAAELARHVRHERLVLVSPFTNMQAMAKARYPFAPSGLLRYPLQTDNIINGISSDIVFFHGDQDSFINISHSKTLQTLTQKPSRLFTVKGARHDDIHEFDEYLENFVGVLPDSLN